MHHLLDLGQPLVTSDSSILREYFHKGTVHVENTAASIAAGLRDAQAREAILRAEMLELRDERRRSWKQAQDRLEALIDSVPAGTGPAPPRRDDAGALMIDAR